ncbi:MAG: hypothetical protein AAB116_27160 [Candidatus Poribacteria bacterium]
MVGNPAFMSYIMTISSFVENLGCITGRIKAKKIPTISSMAREDEFAK